MTTLQFAPAALDRSELLRVLRAVKRGDFSVRMPMDRVGIEGELAEVFNDIIELNEGCLREFARIRDEVGKAGQIHQRVRLPAATGAWADCVDSINTLIGDLVRPSAEVARVIESVAKGDLAQRMALEMDGQPLRGEFLRIGKVVNTMVNQLGGFASEVSRVAREVGTDGKLGGQAQVPGVAGTWKDLTDNVNAMAANLTGQVRNIAEVTTAVAKGDLSKKITVDVKGEILELKSTINTMVDQLNGFASEVSRVAREVGTDGKLGGQAQVPGVAGTWKDLTDNVNAMAANLTGQVRNIAEVTTAVAKGDLSKKITVDVKGEILELKSTINTMVDQLNGFASEVSRVAREVGTDGKLGGQAQVPGVAGTWKDLTDNVNAMAANLTGQVRNIAEVTTAVAKGDLSKKITVDVKGEILELKSTINTMVDQLNGFASEVSRVAREVGTDGKLGGQAQVPGVAGTWKDLTDNVNSMAANLTNQVRGIAQVVTAVAKGDLKRKVVFEAKGEIAALADTINGMIDTLATFGDQVTNVAREVGIEGKLGGQASVPGAAGLWRDLTDNVNQLAAHLTTQVRAIAEVATAVTKGDLTRSIMVQAQGEVAALKDNINEMIRNLKDTTLKNTDQDWLKTNLAKFSRMLQGHRDLVTASRLVLSELAPLVNAQLGVCYGQTARADETSLELLASYASKATQDLPRTLKLGEGLVGQCAYERKRILLTDVPHDYVRVGSVLGYSTPLSVIILPVLFEGEVKAVIELASFRGFSEVNLAFLDQLTETLGIVFNTIEASMRTEDLLKQSQSLTGELQSQQEALKKTNDQLEQQAQDLQNSEALLKRQQEELQLTNEQLQEKARLLSEQMTQVELKNREVEQAKAALEEKAEQLVLSSRYKSEFLANMSHELRTPLNSLLILAKMLADNPGHNLMPKQVEYAQTIHSAGTDLLSLINDILDLAKIESGTVTLDISAEHFSELRDYVDRTFRQLAQDKGLDFTITLDSALPVAVQTDAKRLQQILKNLLSNAIKFTRQGHVSLSVKPATSGWSADHARLNAADRVVMFSVEDTGIGIPPNKQKLIFEAFQQADGTTSRVYGGTGLGLSISRELTRLLGGEIKVESASGRGSTFTLFLPVGYSQTTAEEAPVIVETPLVESITETRPGYRWFTELSPRSLVAAGDDRGYIAPGDRVVLIVEDDAKFAAVLLELVRENGFKGVVAQDGGAALAMTREFMPDAITLDLRLPDMDGWAVLDQLKHSAETRHIPVNVISLTDHMHRCFHLGALGVIHKPAAREVLQDALSHTQEFLERSVKTLLVADARANDGGDLVNLLREDGVEITAVATAKAALDSVQKNRYDCVVVGPALEDGRGVDLLRKFARSKRASGIPIVMYGANDVSPSEQDRLRKLAEVVILKSVTTREAVLRETTLFLHQAIDRLPPTKRNMLADLQEANRDLAGKKVLIIDDDIRNIFAMTGALEQHGLTVINAENGKDGIEMLKANPDVNVVLMDIMMPELDGYDTIRVIRGLGEFRSLPIIAITAKAMKDDREKCIEAGASDYVAKPLDMEQLTSVLRVWLAR